MIALQDPLSIPTTHKDFKNWMHGAGFKLEELDEKHTDILSRYYLCMNDRERDLQLCDLKFELIELKLAIKAVMSLWAQLKSEMD
jgi:hypothetical protein